MSLTIKVPPVGESITEVTLSSWLKKDGDAVKMDEVIAELESDKATFELTAEKAGILTTVAKEGDTLPIGAIVASIEEGGAAAPAEVAPAAQPQPEVVANAPAPAPVEAAPVNAAPAPAAGGSLQVKVPTVGESITEVTLSRWIKKDGDAVAMDEAIAELESDKATFELTAEKAGTLKTIAKEGDVLPIGAVVCTIEGAGVAAPAAKSAEASPAATTVTQATNGKAITYASGTPSPAAAKILAEKGVDTSSVSGTGVAGRITKEDALAAQLISENPQAPKALSGAVPPPTKPAGAPAPKAEPVAAGARSDRREKMSSLRKTVAKRLVAVKNETAMLTTFNEVDMSPIMEIRSKYKDKFKEKHGVGLGFMSFFTKAVCEALKDWPAVGARIEGEEVVYSNFADISIAVSAPKGLVVPVIRNAESMSLAEIEKAVAALAVKARENKLTLEEMTGGTFTITNGGVFGSMMSTPILNSPQSAILGMHNIIERPVAVNGQVVIRPMMYLALSYDHRIIDGRESVSFLVRVKQLLEDPARLLLGV
ncbi:2-oxoglutarate dehydrogenase complex dihydrolipoyllysine-residue succinyltransferase [Mucilaginibacter sp. BJC16-A38]|uniref:2-oxoglutarate dehydrogenase complex dihydrolipoyllysine-residue succinyltransferase n=1 Tax=Mucilaginibacter phenanthrenivorans TaxID=1234842 RepID=UPI0021586C67|nr:2-oxoglutarate dehydrogenase complex dihydrolipoyllysine-residue succinyltransferase [Mucilaginibacter phenanthrenivorans]MCR8557923.1 2-oxoglutarate dehydrogenase complex dihydrolipoyllysine-residue succinyltransferase [Mucilaginibacter phenanthrenivorans]